MAWHFVVGDAFEKQRKEFVKKNRHEMFAVMNNLKKLVDALDAGTKPAQLSLFGFVHSKYPAGILSVDESGHGKGSKPKALRGYVYIDEAESIVHVITVGDKGSQENDVARCKAFVDQQRKPGSG